MKTLFQLDADEAPGMNPRYLNEAYNLLTYFGECPKAVGRLKGNAFMPEDPATFRHHVRDIAAEKIRQWRRFKKQPFAAGVISTARKAVEIAEDFVQAWEAVAP
jgi:hypothetical protein